tara:strand:- start:4057 stop:4398 length:342 start_codon:yes stop_codon:yes gene_type:complete
MTTKIYHLNWYHPNRVWIFNDGALKGEPLYYGFERVVAKLLEKLGAIKYRQAHRTGCKLILSERQKPNTFKFNLLSIDSGGAKYGNEELGKGWIESDALIGTPDILYVGVGVD